jgi:hypothetical protein
MQLRVAIAVLSTVCWAALAGQVSGQIWESGVALLANDRCLDGRIELVGDRYTIKKIEGNQVAIGREQVQFVGKTMREVYDFKRRFLPSNARPGDHYKLAQWCLSVQLLAEAGEHYLKLAQSHPPQSHPSVKKLGVEIKDSMLQQDEFRRYLGMAPIVRPSPDRKSVIRSQTGKSPGAAVIAASGSTEVASRDDLNFGAATPLHTVVNAYAETSPIESKLKPLPSGSQNYRSVPERTGNSSRLIRPSDRLSENSRAIDITNFPVGADIPTAAELNALDDLITTELGFPPVEVSDDPFDPEEFNRLRAVNRRAASGTAPQSQLTRTEQP